MSPTSESIDNALESIQNARQELLLIDPAPSERTTLDEAYNALRRSADLLAKLRNADGAEVSE